MAYTREQAKAYYLANREKRLIYAAVYDAVKRECQSAEDRARRSEYMREWWRKRRIALGLPEPKLVMTEGERRERQREHGRRYREKYREQLRAKGRVYYERVREERLARGRSYYAEHRDEILARSKAWNAANREERRAKDRARNIADPGRQTRWRKLHPENERRHQKSKRLRLTNSVVKQMLKRQKAMRGIPLELITPAMIEAKRAHVKVKRLIKEMRHEDAR